MTYRPAEEKDAQAIADIWNHYIQNTIITFNPTVKSKADIIALIAERAKVNDAFFVAEDADTQVIGFATYGPFRSGLGYAKSKEHTIMLAPNTPSKGHGRGLMQALFTQGIETGVHCLFAGITAQNTAGQAFHRKLGFSTVAIINEVGYKFDTWHDLVLMQKFLRQ